jgi:hypothetical protein
MAVTKQINYNLIGIADADGTNTTTYALHLKESATVTITPIEDVVDDGQTLTSGYDIEALSTVFNTNIISDSRVYSNTAAEPIKARLRFIGATGSISVNVENVIINANQTFDGNRTGYSLKATKRGASLTAVVNVV